MRHTILCFESVETRFIYYNDNVLIFDSKIYLFIKFTNKQNTSSRIFSMDNILLMFH